MRTPQKIALIVGVIVCCAFSANIAAVILLVSAIGIIATLWAEALADVKAEEKFEEWRNSAEYRVWWNSAVVLGKGYNHDGE